MRFAFFEQFEKFYYLCKMIRFNGLIQNSNKIDNGNIRIVQ